jgi:hypothetical protein
MDRLRDKVQQTKMQQSQNAPVNQKLMSLLSSNEIIFDDVDTNVDTSTSNTPPAQPPTNNRNRPPICGPICQQKKRRRTFMIVGIGIAVLGVTYFIFRKK